MNRSKDFEILGGNPEAASQFADAVRKGIQMAKDAKKEPKPIYTAIFLDEVSREALLKAFPPLHQKVFGHHVTLAFYKAGSVDPKVFEPYLEQEVTLGILGGVSDDKGQAVKVTLPPAYAELNPGQVHHVTISCVGSPIYSNELIQRLWMKPLEMRREGRPHGWSLLDSPLLLKGTVRHFTK